MTLDAARDAHVQGQQRPIDLREDEQLALAEVLAPKWPEFPQSWSRYTNPRNGFFGLADGAVYYSILRTLRPKTIVEVGAGFTSAIALDARDQYEDQDQALHDLQLIVIDPNPERLYELVRDQDYRQLTIHRDLVQNVPIELFDALEKDDILFIDSSHVSKKGSDVNWLFFEVLPRLRPGVIVHIHDIFFPFDYPDAWHDHGFNETYVLQAFLNHNNVYQIMFYNSWFWQEHADIVNHHSPEAALGNPGSIWLRKASAPQQAPEPEQASAQPRSPQKSSITPKRSRASDKQ